MNKYFYEKSKVLEDEIYCIGINNIPNNYKENEVVSFTGEQPFFGYPILENDTIRQATEYELYLKSIYKLKKNEYIKNNKILKYSTEELKINKIIPLVPGEYIQDDKLIKVELSDNFLLPVWNVEKRIWEEGTSEDGLIKEQDRILQEYKEKLFALGYNWNGHCQKARAKDIALLESVISSAKLSIEKGLMKRDDSINWYFNRSDKSKLKLEDFYNLKLAGITFIQEIYDIEAIFKEEIRIDITFEEFLLKFRVTNG